MSSSSVFLPHKVLPQESSFDLHGYRVPAAREKVKALFKEAKLNNASKLTLVTGIGSHENDNGTRGVLYHAMRKWLEAPEIKRMIKEVRLDMGAYEIILNNPEQDEFLEKVQAVTKAVESILFSPKAVEEIKRKAEEGSIRDMYLLGGLMINGNVVKEDPEEGAKWVEAAANAGDSSAQMQMGFLYSIGKGVPHSYEASRKWHTRAIQKDPQPDSLATLGKYYWLGQGVKKDDAKALDYLKRAAEMGEPAAAFSLGKIYLEGDPAVPVDGTLAAKYFEIAAKEGLIEAKILLAKQLFFGWADIPINYQKAHFFFMQAAQKKDPIALYYLGRMYSEGLGVDKDPKAGFQWYEKSANLGDKDAEHTIAFASIEGTVTEQNVSEGIKKLTNLAENDHRESAALLGELYFFGKKDLILPDLQNAFRYLELAATQGFLSSQRLLWELQLSKTSVFYDPEAGEKWLKAAIEQNDAYSMYFRGLSLDNSPNATQHTKEILDLYTQAAKQKLPEALYMLGLAYREGEIAPLDKAKGQALIEEAAKAGHSPANFTIGKELIQSPDLNKQKDGVGYLVKSAATGHPNAQVGLGHCYESGIGVKKSREEAIKWFKKAADQKDTYALNKMGCLSQEDKKLEMALNYFLEAANLGFDLAKINAVRIILQRQDFFRHIPHILTLIRPLADSGNPQGEHFLGQIYLHPKAGHTNLKEALVWLKKSFAHGSREAGAALLNLIIAKSNLSSEALSILTAEAERGNHTAFIPLISLALEQSSFSLGNWVDRAASEGDIITQFSIAYLHLKRSQTDRAIWIFDQLLKKEPADQKELETQVNACRALSELTSGHEKDYFTRKGIALSKQLKRK